MLTWHTLPAGHVFEPVTYRVTAEAVAAYCDAVGIEHPWYTGASPFGGPIVPPTIITSDYSALLAQVLPPFTGMHAKHRLELFAPIPVDAPVHVTGVLEEKYVKRGRHYLVVAYEARGEDGTLFARNRIATTVDIPPGEPCDDL